MNDVNPEKTKHTALKTGLHAWSLVLAIVILVPAAYGYLYYSNRDTYLTGHYFRALSEIERQINLGLKGLDHLVDSALVEQNPDVRKEFCQKKGKDKGESYCEKYKDYLKRYSSMFKHIKFFNASKDCQKKAEEEGGGGSDVTCFEITGVVDNRKSTVFQKEGELAAKVPLKDLIDPVPALKYFNQILLLDRTGNLIYRSGADDLLGTDNYAARDDFSRFESLIYYLTTEKSSSLDARSLKMETKQVKRPALHSTVREATIGNVTFRLFIQPFHAVRQQYIATPPRTEDASKTGDRKSNTFQAEEITYLVGVVAEERYFFDVISLPLGRITMLIFAMLFVVLLMPHMKLFFSGIHFMPTRIFAWWLALSFPLLVTIIIIGVLSANEYVRLRESVGQTAKVLGDRIAENLEYELSRTIRLISDRQSIHKRRHEHAEKPCFVRGKRSEYPEFEQAFYLNKDGKQVGNQITFRSFPSSRIKVDKRDYFKRPRLNPETLMVWARDDGQAPQPYFSERIQTYNHGIKLAAFSFPSPAQLVLKCPSNAVEAGESSVVALIKLMHTFFKPVLPVGFGFAVIDDRTGNVLYHSNDQRSLLENFYIESDENDALIAAVQMRHERFVAGNYNGLAHWFWSKPLEMTPWSLVVFYDTAMLELANFKTSVYSMAIAGVIIIFLMVVFYVVSLILKYFGVWHCLERFSPKAVFWAEQKRRRLFHVIRFSTVYLFCVGALLLIVCGGVSKLTFDTVNRDQMELLSRVNLAHIGAKMIERKIALTAEFQRVVAPEGDEPLFDKDTTYLRRQLYAFANYAKNVMVKEASSHENKPATQKRLPWLVTIDETSSGCAKEPSDRKNGDGLLAWLSEHLPVLNRADARSRYLRDDHAVDGNRRFRTCAADSEPDELAAQFRGDNRRIVRMNGSKAPASTVERGLEDWQWGLYAFFIIVLLYNLMKLTAQRLLGLGFPSATRWRQMLSRYQSESPLAMLSFSGRADRKTAKSNLKKIAEASTGPLVELKSILFNRSRERLINTANIAPLMWLINSGILKNRRGNIGFRDPAMMEWLQEQPWEKEISAYQAEEQPNLWRIMAPPFYAVMLLALGFLVLSGGQVGDLLLALLPFTLAGGLPFINQLFDKFFRD